MDKIYTWLPVFLLVILISSISYANDKLYLEYEAKYNDGQVIRVHKDYDIFEVRGVKEGSAFIHHYNGFAMGIVSNQRGAQPMELTPGRLNSPGNSWEINCYVDAMTDREWCQVVLRLSYYGQNFEAFYYNGSQVCVSDSNDPTKSALIRLDKNPPHEAIRGGNCFNEEISAQIVNEMLESDQLAVRLFAIPYQGDIDVKTSTFGFSVAVDLAGWMLRHIR